MTDPLPFPAGDIAREARLISRQSRAARWRHVAGLFSSYWLSRDWKFAWFALIILLLHQFGTVYILVAANRWQQAFFDSVEQKQIELFVPLLFTFIVIMVAQVGTSLISNYFSMAVGIRWRTELTRRYLDRWMSRNRFAEIERLRLIDNPDQRIADDINAVTGEIGIFSISLSLLGMVVGAISFSMILLETAEPIRVAAFGTIVSIPGSTVWYAVIYAFVGSYIITRIGAPYVRAKMRQQHVEADFRASMIHVRRNAGQIGFAQAVPTERNALANGFERARHNFQTVIYSTLGINFGQGIYERIGSILPLFLMIPRYFAGAISFGQVMGARDAFQSLVGQLSFIVQAYSRIGTQIACINRLKALDDALDDDRPRGIAFMTGPAVDAVLKTRDLVVYRPDGAPMVGIDDWVVHAGERWVVRGPSGAGKSTLLRAVVGLWPDGQGEVMLNADLDAMFVPQRLYLPLGTLKGSVCFPRPEAEYEDAAILALLERTGLGAHTEQLSQVRYWQEELSPGEQQRVALARILLHRPQLLIVDEGTSALDPENARLLYEELLVGLPDVTLISVVHDDRLTRHHTHCLTITDGIAQGAAIGHDE